MEMIKGTLSRKVTQPGWTNFFGCRFPIISRWSTTGNRHIIQNACSAVMEENLSFAGSQHTRGQDYNRLSSQTLADLVCQSKANEMVIQYHRRVTMTVFHLQQRREWQWRMEVWGLYICCMVVAVTWVGDKIVLPVSSLRSISPT